jgi:hypothetical protein
MLFIAGGSNHFFLPHGIIKSEKVETQRKIYNGNFKFTPELKLTFRRVEIDKLTEFFNKAIPANSIRDLMATFGVPDDIAEDKIFFCKALAYQFEAFVRSNTQEAEDIVLIKYQLLLKYGDEQTEVTKQTRYPGDKIKVIFGREKKYQVNCYDVFQHAWTIANTGTVEWKDRRLILTNSTDIELKFESIYLNVPSLKTGEQAKITTSIEARGIENTAICKWIMADKDGNNCFPEDENLYFTVTVKFN